MPSSPLQRERSTNPVLVSDTGDVIVYQYPLDFDDDDFPDDGSLAAKDALALERDGRSFDHDKRQSKAEDPRRRRRRVLMLIVAGCLLIGVIVATTLLRSNKKANDAYIPVGTGVAVNNVVGEAEDVPQQPPQTQPPSSAPPTSVAPVTSEPTTSSPVTPLLTTLVPSTSPSATPSTLSPTSDVAMNVLSPRVYDSSLLMKPMTSEGQAFAIVAAENRNLSEAEEIIKRYALLTLYFASNGDAWRVNDGWRTQTTDACSWYGNNCEDGDLLKDTKLDGNNLLGTLPNDICLLTTLERLILSANLLVGELPPCVSSLIKLKELHLNGNFFTGPLPKNLHTLPDLTRLSLDFNNFSGNVHAMFSGVQDGDPVFPKLQTLNLHNNGLGGTVPDSNLAAISSLKAMTLDSNPSLSGSLDSCCTDGHLQLVSADCTNIECSCCISVGNC